MKVSGFTLVRNGVRFDYPYLESLRSILPIVDELVVNVGSGDDDTLAQVRDLAQKNPKMIVFESNWALDDPAKKRGGLILSEQTNLALDRCVNDWCIYLQADEILHEGDYVQIRNALEHAHQNTDIEGLLFEYLHFYGSFGVVQKSRSTYRREVRAVRKSSAARSVGDAQSFRKADGQKLAVVNSGARVFHYGWVRTPEAMREKTFFMDQLYHGNPTEEQTKNGMPHTGENYRYKRIWGLKAFTGSHPSVMKDRIESKNWNWDLKNSPLEWNWRDLKKVALDSVERFTGMRLFEYRSYRQMRK